MGVNDDFWDDLLGHIRQQVLVPVVGPDLTVVNVGGAEQTFTSLIGKRLAERWNLSVPPGLTTGGARPPFLRARSASSSRCKPTVQHHRLPAIAHVDSGGGDVGGKQIAALPFSDRRSPRAVSTVGGRETRVVVYSRRWQV